MTAILEDRGIALITGGCGAMGLCCARSLGQSHDLLLMDTRSELLAAARHQLFEEGYTVCDTISGDIRDPETHATLAAALAKGPPLRVIVHTAGISTFHGDWQMIIDVNHLGTMRLLESVEPFLSKGSAAVVIASNAGHMLPPDAERDALIDSISAERLPDLRASIDELRTQFPSFAVNSIGYMLSKRAVIRTCESRAAEWAKRGARINSVSPGVIWTPMARGEIDRGNNTVQKVLAATPAGRYGTVMDIANAVGFLVSSGASFITGTDLRVDGGVSPSLGVRH